MTADYYARSLSAQRLVRCYEAAPPRVRRYLEAEIGHVLERIAPNATVLDLGCGYGRVLDLLAQRARFAAGVDTSADSLALARARLGARRNCALLHMDAAALAFRDESFDVVVCIQNGISAFGRDRRQLFAEALRVTRSGGRVLFSSYAACFWEARMEWFRAQSALGLIGEIDEEATRDGVIVCKDGFRASTVGAAEFRGLAAGLPARCEVREVDASSIFCELVK
ncbi:MAG: class I SAM-dependent methyltransferase [Planctomycetes bacterium]|nr:class I SAM-dependent methyltransferase [Planctomycetota bacterium]